MFAHFSSPAVLKRLIHKGTYLFFFILHLIFSLDGCQSSDLHVHIINFPWSVGFS